MPNIRGSRFRRVELAGDDAPRAARPRQHPDGDVGAEPHVARDARPVGAREHCSARRRRRRPSVETNLDETAPAGTAPTTMRQRLERHMADPGCAACHNLMDPLGFALENFDFIGSVAGC